MAIDLKSIKEEKSAYYDTILNEFTEYVESREFDEWVESLARDTIYSHADSFKFTVSVGFEGFDSGYIIGTLLLKEDSWTGKPAFMKTFGVEFAEQMLSEYFNNFRDVINKKLSKENMKYTITAAVLNGIVEPNHDRYVPWSEKLRGCHAYVVWEVSMSE